MPTSDASQPSPGQAVISFHDLMRFRVMDVLLVASPYDTFLLEEAGQLPGREAGEFRNLDVHYEPCLTSVARGSQALDRLKRDPDRYDLVVSTVRAGDMDVAELARRVHERRPDLPVILLAFDAPEMKNFVARRDVSGIERAFLWQGDARILQAIVKYVEDWRNAEDDTQAGVQVILLVEDNVRRYSSFLPVLYTELLRQSQKLLPEGLNLAERIARMRARPKVLLCSTFEQAWGAFEQYRHAILGVISDIDFPRADGNHEEAGFELAQRVRATHSDVPVILHSSHEDNVWRAAQVGAGFLPKGSPRLHAQLRDVLAHDLGFGDFVFRCHENGPEVARAWNLRTLEARLREVPAESIVYHAARHHFSRWLKARTEFGLARILRRRNVGEYAGPEDVRRDLIESLAAYRAARGALSVADFDPQTFDPAGFYRLGGGSLGGKARGLAFARRRLALARRDGRLSHQITGDVPSCLVLATDVFERFLEENRLRDFAVECDDDRAIEQRFLEARFPEDVQRDLAAFLEKVCHPLAVRSSSLLEDSHYQPFTGVYATYMLPNLHPVLEVRLEHLVQAVQRVYASTFSSHTKAYLQATGNRLEEEKMAVIIQRLVGSQHDGRFYPDFAGVARSHNFYPTPPLEPRDGIVAVALGLGRTVVEGDNCLRFSPRYPRQIVSFSSAEDVLQNSQRDFWALELREPGSAGEPMSMTETRFELSAAEADGTLALLGSTYSHDNRAVYDGLSRAGLRVVTFAAILKHDAFPLAETMHTLLELARESIDAPVEIEFAVDLRRREFGVLQMRPLPAAHDDDDAELEALDPERVLCRSAQVLGHGRVDDLYDVLVVDAARFERARSREVAQELAQINARLVQAQRAYLLIGVGRWGSRDPWLGIPVTWDQISGARAIVEAGLRDVRVTPSQGSHFFQNLTSFNVAYFTVNPDLGEGFVDWEWLRAQPACYAAGALRHLRFEQPLVVRMDGPRRAGVVLKPAAAPACPR